MDIISSLADKMVKGQSFDFKSFKDAKETIVDVYEDKELYIIYDRLSLLIYSHNLTLYQFQLLDMPLRTWLESHNNEDQKMRIEYGILLQYALLFPEYQDAQIIKSLHPDFIVSLGGKTIGIEVTRLEKETDSVMSKILVDIYKPGMKPNEVMDLAFKKHGYKALEYRVTEAQKNVLAIQHIDNMLITTEAFVEIIGKKITRYRDKTLEFDEFLILCNAQHGITITSENDANNLLDDTFSIYSKPNMNIAVLYLNQNNILECVEYNPRLE